MTQQVILLDVTPTHPSIHQNMGTLWQTKALAFQHSSFLPYNFGEPPIVSRSERTEVAPGVIAADCAWTHLLQTLDHSVHVVPLTVVWREREPHCHILYRQWRHLLAEHNGVSHFTLDSLEEVEPLAETTERLHVQYRSQSSTSRHTTDVI